MQGILSFDVEEHWRIEAARGLSLDEASKSYYAGRVSPPTHWILDELERYGQRATFFLVAQLARQQPELVRAIHRGGHEVANHGWDHQRVHNFSPAQFHDDIRQSKDALEQIIGEAVVGYRAPTFSIVRQTAWALDVLAENGVRYDSSIYPVRHDRYGVPDAPRGPFRAGGFRHEILELPPACLASRAQNERSLDRTNNQLREPIGDAACGLACPSPESADFRVALRHGSLWS